MEKNISGGLAEFYVSNVYLWALQYKERLWSRSEITKRTKAEEGRVRIQTKQSDTKPNRKVKLRQEGYYLRQ